MSQHAKAYPVKSNAARAAKRFGLTRADLFEVDGGWSFNEPAGAVGELATTAATTTPASKAPASKPASHPDFYPPSMGGNITDPSHPDYDARAAHTVDHSTNGNGGEAATTQESVVKTKAKTKAKAKANGKAAKPAKKAKTAKPAKAGAKAKRKAGPKTGKTAAFISECKARFTSAEDAMKRYGWTSNTLRGVLGNHKLKTGDGFERKKIDGVTHYRIAA